MSQFKQAENRYRIFRQKCNEKLFSISFSVVHPDQKSCICQMCGAATRLRVKPSYLSEMASTGRFVGWTCSTCSNQLVSLPTRSKQNVWYFISNAVRKSIVQGKNKIKFVIIANRAAMVFIVLFSLGFLAWNGALDNFVPNNKSSTKAEPNVVESLYRGTKVAKQEFYTYRKAERQKIQQFLRQNFGYNSSIDGLWGPQTARSYLSAARKYIPEKSLYSSVNVNIVFELAIKETTKNAASEISRQSERKSNQLGLTTEQFKTYQYFINLCGADVSLSGDRLVNCTKNAMCLAKFGSQCVRQPAPLRIAPTCYVSKGPFDLSPDQIICQ
jgi:hypothetical protein